MLTMSMNLDNMFFQDFNFGKRLPALPAHISLVFLKAKAFVSVSEVRAKLAFLVVKATTKFARESLLGLLSMVAAVKTEINKQSEAQNNKSKSSTIVEKNRIERKISLTRT